eukprot:2368008-Rhodomonas_salina.2
MASASSSAEGFDAPPPFSFTSAPVFASAAASAMLPAPLRFQARASNLISEKYDPIQARLWA